MFITCSATALVAKIADPNRSASNTFTREKRGFCSAQTRRYATIDFGGIDNNLHGPSSALLIPLCKV
jgi:hypothetical protein